MHSTQLLQVLAVALTAFTAAHANVVDVNIQPAADVQLIKRQSDTASPTSDPPASSTPSTTSPKTTSAPPPPSSTPSTTSPRATSTPPPNSPNSPNSPSSTPTKPGTSPTTDAPASQTSNTTPPPTTSKSSESTSTGPPTTSTWTSTIIVTENGQVSTQTTSGTTTSTPGLANGGSGNSQQSGMSDQQRNTIIGVVCGIGGAIVLAVVGIVAWRVWGRKKNQDESEGAFGPSYSPAEKANEPTGSQSSRTPFQSTLESYHAPTQVNTASNF